MPITTNSTIQYHNIAHTIHNSFILVSMLTLYLIFAVMLMRHRCTHPSVDGKFTGQSTAFLQIVLISGVNAVGCALYVIMQFHPDRMNPALIYCASYAWLAIHGLPPVIYLTLNQTVRDEVWALVASE